MGVQLVGLVPTAQHTPDLFDQPLPTEAQHHGLNTAQNHPAPRDRTRLMAAMDSLNRRHGKNAVYFASAHAARNEAPMRIAFSRIPDLDTER